MINKTVLVVERDPSEAARILDFFRNNNFRNKVEVVHSKAEALAYIFATGQYADRKPETPGLILLDLQTNHTKDMNVLQPLQAYLRTQKIPIIILTSSAEQEKELNFLDLSTIGFMRKPLEFTHFIELIQHMGIQWRST